MYFYTIYSRILTRILLAITVITSCFIFSGQLFTLNSLNSIDAHANENSSVNVAPHPAIPAGFFTTPDPTGKVSREIEYMHDGLDISDKYETPILAAADGVVIYTQKTLQNSGGYGYYILLQHKYQNQLLYTLYAHLAEAPQSTIGDTVVQGQAIGLMGDTGNATGIHLHFSIMTDIKLENNQIRNHPNCLKQYESYASTCISPLSEPVSITSYKAADTAARKTNPANTLSNLIDLQTINTGSDLDKNTLDGILFDIFLTDQDACKKQNPALGNNYTDLVYQCSTIYPQQKTTLRNNRITRADFATLLINAIRQSSKGRSVLPQSITFASLSDVDEQNTHYSDIQRIINAQVMQKSNNGEFHPEKVISRKEAGDAITKASELIFAN